MAHQAAHLSSPSGQSSTSANNTFVMSASPIRRRAEGYKPRIITTVGARPACLVNASVTYVGNDQIYAFGGFDQFTDEVYNHVLRLNLSTKQWNLVDNYGDIPGVRMGHTANLWQGDKLLVYGGENEHRSYLSDVIIFDLKTAHWTQPELHGVPPRGRARHAAVIHDEKLFVMGGMTTPENTVLDDICWLDLKTWTWGKTWRFVPRYDHTAWVWDSRIWIIGGLGVAMERSGDVWWFDPRGSPTFDTTLSYGAERSPAAGSRSRLHPSLPSTATGSSGYAANSSSIQTSSMHMSTRNPPIAPGSISSLTFISSPNLPAHTIGTHFHMFSSGCLLDFATPSDVISPVETSLSALDLQTLRWLKLADGRDLFNPDYRWHYCAVNDDATHAWLLGCPADNMAARNAGQEEYLSDVLPIDLRRLGLLGNRLTPDPGSRQLTLPASDSHNNSIFSGIGADLAHLFDQPPEAGSETDFMITAQNDDEALSDDEESIAADANGSGPASSNISQPIHVHKLILQARWPHFRRLYKSQMLEFHTKKMHIPEPYRAVRAFLYYLYTDSIAQRRLSTVGTGQEDQISENGPNDHLSGPSLTDVGGMLVMANIYDMPRLRLLCVNRLGNELDVPHAAAIWERALTAGEDWLKQQAAHFCMKHWGRIIRSEGFKLLPKRSLLELCEEVDTEARVVGADELEAVGGLGGGKLGVGGMGATRDGRRRALGSAGMLVDGDDTEADGDDEAMETN